VFQAIKDQSEVPLEALPQPWREQMLEPFRETVAKPRKHGIVIPLARRSKT